MQGPSFLPSCPLLSLSPHAPHQQYRPPSLLFRCMDDWQFRSEQSLCLHCQRWRGFLPSVSRYELVLSNMHHHTLHGYIPPFLLCSLTGTSIKFYGILTGGASSWYLEPDGIPKNVLAKASFTIDTPSLILSVDNLQDGDHQLYGEVSAINNGTVMVHYFESVLLLLITRVLTTLLRPGLKILQERASSFSVLGRMHQTSPHRQSLWMTLARILQSINPTGHMPQLFGPTLEVSCRHRLLVIR